MARVFLSYVREDLDEVERLATLLRVYGIEVWLDRDHIMPGQRWKDAIRRAIGEGDFFIACFSKEYSERSRTYMNEELTLAIDELRQRPTDRAWFIPVLLSDTTIPDRSIGAGETLRSIQWVTLYEHWHDGVARILSIIEPGSGKIHNLVQNLTSSSARARIAAIDQLGILGPLAKEAVPHLVGMLRDENETVRAAAAEALGKIGVASEEVVTALLLIMRSAEVYYASSHAAKALRNLGPLGISALLEATTFSGYAVGSNALENVVAMGQAAVPSLVELVMAGHHHSKWALHALTEIQGPAALPEVTKLLLQGTPEVRAAATSSIERIFWFGELSNTAAVEAAIAALITAVQDRSLRLAAIKALSRAGRMASSAVPSLIEALEDVDARILVMEALRNIGEGAAAAVPNLIAALAGEDTRLSAVRALGGIGVPAKVATPNLLEALTDHSSEIRNEAAKALGRMGPVPLEVVGTLVDALDENEVQWEAALELGNLGKAAEKAVPRLVRALRESEDWAFRWRLANALGKIGDPQAVEHLMSALSDMHEKVRSNAAQALGRIGNRDAIRSLLKQSFDPESGVRWSVIEALVEIGQPYERDVVNRLVAILEKDDNVGARRCAARALARIGDPANLPALKKALNDKHELVRSEAEVAIKALETL